MQGKKLALRRTATLFLVIAFSLALMVGCATQTPAATSAPSASAQPSSETTGSAAPTPEPTQAANVNAYGWEVPDELLTINCYFGQGEPDNKFLVSINDWLEENFNVRVNKFQYDSDRKERVNLMLATGDYPEAIGYMSATETADWIARGKALEITSLYEQSPNLVQKFGPYVNYFKEADGKLYSLASGWGGKEGLSIPSADNVPQVRWDWYEEIGSPEIVTTDDYFNALEAMVAKHPTNEKGDKVYALTYIKSNTAVMTTPFMGQMAGYFGLKSGWDISADNTFTHWINSPKGLEAIKYINRFARAGLLDPDAITMDYDQYSERAIAERYAGFVGAWWIPGYYAQDQWLKLEGENYQQNKRYIPVTVKAPGVEHATSTARQYMGYGRLILTDKCTNPEAYMKWFDFENSDIGMRIIGSGIPNQEGSIWTYDETAKTWSWKPERVAEITADIPAFNFEPYEMLGGEAALQLTSGYDLLSDGSNSNVWFNQSNKDKWKKLKDEILADTIYDFTSYYTIAIPNDHPVLDVSIRCADLISTGFVKMIYAATEEECEKLYYETQAAAKQAGFEDYERFYSEQYQANLARFGQ